jgi:CTP synthase
VAEVAGHPWMVGTQYHPEFKSRPNRPHPLFQGFMRAVLAHSAGRKLESIETMPRAAPEVVRG